MELKTIDSNMHSDSAAKNGVVYYNAEKAPIKSHGFFCEEAGKPFLRIPQSVAQAQGMSENIRGLNTNASGGRFIFRTNSERITLRYQISENIPRDLNLQSVCSMDLYCREHHKQTLLHAFKPDSNTLFEEIVMTCHTGNCQEKELILYAPLFASIRNVFIGIDEGASIGEGDTYKVKDPVVFYGSSITQGACADRPGLTYPALISRHYDMDFLNLGFAGNARGETAMAQYIASLKMSAFVYDYDHNAPTAEHLAMTHEPFYQVIRENNPELPVIIVSRPHAPGPDTEKRKEIIYQTYRNACDRKEPVYFVDGCSLYGSYGDDAVMDDAHPSSIGLYAMAKGIGKIVAASLEKDEEQSW